MPFLALLSSLAASATILVAGGMPPSDSEPAHAGHEHRPSSFNWFGTPRDSSSTSTLPQRPTTFLGCVSGPDHGAMGVHYVNSALVGDGEIDASRPEALIYEPSKEGLRLVGVEFIVDAATWLAHHNTPPVLEGQVFQIVTSPNRYALPTQFELHVWAWRDNPNGAFVDWNNRVTCEHQ